MNAFLPKLTKGIRNGFCVVHIIPISNHISQLSKGLDNYISYYDNILFLRDLNSQSLENCVNSFCNVYNLSNLGKELKCYKNPDNSFCIELFLTNRPKCFQSTMTMETGISDFHKMVITALNVFTRNKDQKSFTTETIKPSIAIYLRKN